MKRIVSAVPGRLRVKDPQLFQRGKADRFIARSASVLPLLSSRANPLADSIVLYYDAGKMPSAEAQKHIERTLAELLRPGTETPMAPARRRSRRLRINRYAKICALASLGVSLASAYAGPKRLHIISGWIFVACLGAHLAVFRRTLTH